MIFEIFDNFMGEIAGNMLQRQFFEMLSTAFTKQDAVKQAEVLGVPSRTMERWLAKSIQSAEIKRITIGSYQKLPPKYVSA